MPVGKSCGPTPKAPWLRPLSRWGQPPKGATKWGIIPRVMTDRAPRSRQHSPAARAAHAGIALLAGSGIATSLYLGWTDGSQLPDGVGFSGGFAAGWEHMLNQPAYFTFLSGLLVLVTSTMLAVRTHRRSPVFQAVRLAAVVQMIITGVVFNVLLRDDAVFTGVRLFNDTVLHQLLPVLVPLVWLIVGPFGQLTGRVVAGSMVIPLTWLAVTLLRGPGLDWYPYTILDVPRMGYDGVGVYVGAIVAVYLALACGFWAVDRLFSRRSRRSASL